MKGLSFFLLTILTSFIAHAKVSCKLLKSDTWFIVNSDKGDKILGSSESGYTSEEWCNEHLPSNDQVAVCSWNGQTFQLYDIDSGTPLGTTNLKNQYPQKTSDMCVQHAAMQPSNTAAVCAWNGHYYTPYMRNNTLLGAEKNGWKDMGACVKDALPTLTKKTICSWNKGSALYSLHGKMISPSLGKIDECKSLQRVLEGFKNADSVIASLEKTNIETLSEKGPLPFKSNLPNENVGFSLKSCANPNHRYHLTKNVDGYIVPECQPDTLYSWGGFEKLEWFIKNLPNGKSWPDELSRSLFTTLSPVATFGYGTVPIRIKLEPFVKMKLLVNPEVSTCDAFVEKGYVNSEDFKNTVIVRTALRKNGLSFQEYIICSSKVINSWSYLTEDHYDEILKDFHWATNKNYIDWEGYDKKNGKDNFIDDDIDASAYNTDFSLKTFNTRLNFLRFLSEANMGKIHTRAGQKEAADSHFMTALPIYFNDN